MVKETHVVRVVLKSGATLTTRETLESQEEADELIENVYEDRSTTWKDVGGIRFRFGELAALQVEEL
jgi:hypothetical protein